MQLSELDVTPIALPFRETYRTASGELTSRSMAVVRLRSTDGHRGLGEAVPLSLRGGPSLERVVAELEACGAELAGAEADPAASADPIAIGFWIAARLASCRARGVGLQALAALDTALHDLAGRASAMPVWRLLGAAATRDVECNATLDAGEPEQVARLAAEQRAAGFTTHKVKVGRGADTERVAAVRDAVGPEARIRVDANGAWDVEAACRALAELEPYRIELAEQPAAALAELAEIRARTEIPVVADESVATVADARAARDARACDAATLKLAKVGGPLAALEIADVVPSYLSSALDGPIGIAAAVHTAQAMPRAGVAGELANGLATLGLFGSLYASVTGLLAPVLTAAPSPGLGVDLDERALEELRIP